MKRFYTTALALAFAVGVGTMSEARAQVTTSYVETFEGLDTSDADFAPKGWGHIVDVAYVNYSSESVDYTAVAAGGHDDGAYLGCADQTFSDDDGWYSTEVTTDDILVAPASKGTVTFYLQKSKYSGNVKLYECTTENGVTFTMGNRIELPADIELSDSEWVQVTLQLEEYTRIGFRLENMRLDDYAASEAMIVAKRALSIESDSFSAGVSGGDVMLDADGKAEVTITYTLKNKGDETLNPGDEDYALEVITYYGDKVWYTFPIDFALEAGATSEPHDMVVTFDMGDLTEEESLNVGLREKISGTEDQVSWLDFIPYIAKLAITYDDDKIEKPINFGIVSESTSKTIELENTGAAPVVITDFTMPAGYSFDNLTADSLPFTIASKESVELELTLSSATENYTDSISFVFEGEGDTSFAVEGLMLEDGVWIESFEEKPAGWLFPEGTNWSYTVPGYVTTGHLTNSTSSDTTLVITPKMVVEEGDALHFFAARYSNYGDPFMTVCYSADRVNWTTVATLLPEDDYPDAEYQLPSYGTEYSHYAVDAIPAGEWYIAFGAGYVSLDDVFGYKPADVTFDLYPAPLAISGKTMVNNEVGVEASVNNILADTLSGALYNVALYADDVLMDTLAGVDIEPSATATFNFAFTPHQAGVMNLSVKFAALDGSYEAATPVLPVTIATEVAALEQVVGAYTAEQIADEDFDTELVPVSGFYNNSLCETLYTAEKLDLGGSCDISAIGFPYFTTADYTGHVRVWLQNCADSIVGEALSDTTKLTKVFEGDYTFPAGGTDTNMVLARIDLNSSFAYEGASLRLVIEKVATTYKHVGFAFEETAEATSLYKRIDNYTSYVSAEMNTIEQLPIVHLFVDKAPAVVSGSVTEATSGAILANTALTFTAGNVIYSTVSDANGAYSLDIIQTGKAYDVTANVADFAPYSTAVTVPDSGITNNVALTYTALPEATVVGTNTLDTADLATAAVVAPVGTWSVDDFATLSTALENSSALTALYLASVDVPAEIAASSFATINPNAIIYMSAEEDAILDFTNVALGDNMATLALSGSNLFAPIKTLQVSEASYTRPSAAPSTICLPFAVSEVTGCTVSEFTGVSGGSANFDEVDAMDAYKPYLVAEMEGDAITFTASDVEVTTDAPIAVEVEGVTFVGTMSPIDNSDATHYVVNNYGFDATAAMVSAFECYLSGVTEDLTITSGGIVSGVETAKVADMEVFATVGAIVIRTSVAQDVNIYTLAGSLVRTVRAAAGETVVDGLAQGFYFVNNHKVVVR